MSMYTVTENTTPELENLAIGVLKYGNQLAELLVQKYRAGLSMLYYRSAKEDGTDFTIADLQVVTDAMGDQATDVFADSYAFGQFINAAYPGALGEAELTAPVAYTLDETGDYPRIVWDTEAEYPGPTADPANPSE